MKISFVIPAYNEEKSIGRCIESIKKEYKGQLSDIEIIVVNNASTDRTKEIATGFSGVTVVDEPRKGLGYARQAGFLASTGDIVANIDADAILPSGWIEKVLEEFSKDEKLVALSGPFVYYDLSRWTNVLVKFFYGLGYATHVINHALLGVGAMLQGGNFVLRRSALVAIGGFNVNIEFYGEDTDIARRIQKIGKVKFTFGLPMPTSGRRLKEEGVIATGIRYTANYFWVTFLKKPLTKKHQDIRIDTTSKDRK